MQAVQLAAAQQREGEARRRAEAIARDAEDMRRDRSRLMKKVRTTTIMAYAAGHPMQLLLIVVVTCRDCNFKPDQRAALPAAATRAAAQHGSLVWQHLVHRRQQHGMPCASCQPLAWGEVTVHLCWVHVRGTLPLNGYFVCAYCASELTMGRRGVTQHTAFGSPVLLTRFCLRLTLLLMMARWCHCLRVAGAGAW